MLLAGKIKEIIDFIIKERSKGNPAIKEMTIAKLILKGLNPNKFNSESYDDPLIIDKLLNIAEQMNIKDLDNKCIDIKSVFSIKYLEEEVVEDIKKKLNNCNTKLLIYFASSKYDQNKLSRLLNEAFNNCVVVGCSTAGEIVSGAILKNSVVAMSISSNIISDVKVEVVEHIKENLCLDEAFASFENYFNKSLYEMNEKKYVGITLIDGISKKEEKLMELIGDRTNVFFISGSAADDQKYCETYVSAEGKVYTDSAVLLLLKIDDNAEFDIIKTQSFEVLDQVLIANKVNEEAREVIEFNNKPALIAYAEAIGIKAEDAENYFMTNPVGLIVGENDVYIRAPQQIKDLSILFFCNILEGMEVRLLKSTDIISDTKNAIQDKMKNFGQIDGIINFHCVERTLELEKKSLEKEYGEIFANIPTIGFSTYGEGFIGHMNQTAVMLVFRKK